MDIINTTKNKKYKFIKSLQQKKTRLSEGLFVVEGTKSVSDVISSEYDVHMIAMNESYYNENSNLYFGSCDVITVADALFDGLCDTKTPQGILAVVKMRENVIGYDKNELYIYCDNVSDPGNLGTIIRTADAAGFKGVMLSCGCTDPYNPKCVRASMGSFFNIDIYENISYDFLSDLSMNGTNLYCGALGSDSIIYTDIDFTKPCIIVVGNEANGVSQDLLKRCQHVIIPIHGKAESLNVGVASAILMYEAVRQRGNKDE